MIAFGNHFYHQCGFHWMTKPIWENPVLMLMDGLFVNQANGNYVMDKCAWETCASWPRVNG